MFANPAMLWWLAAALPAILIFYFLKMRRETRVVSSVLLWRRSVYDLRVNAPLQMIKRNLLLFLQLLIATLIILALARPVVRMVRSQGKRTVVIVDCSASMATREANGLLRMEMARQKAIDLIAELASGDSGVGANDEMCLIAAADQPEMLCGFTADKQTLREAASRLEVRGTVADMAAALEMAIAMTTASAMTRAASASTAIADRHSPGREASDRSSLPVSAVIISDGAFAPLPLSLARRVTVAMPGEEESGGVVYMAVGETQSDNLGIVAADVRTVGGMASEPCLFLLLQNSSAQERKAEVKVEIDGRFIDRKETIVPGRRSASGGADDAPGQTAVLFALPVETQGLLAATLSPGGNFSFDDKVQMVIKPPRPIAVALVSEGNYFLSTALDACQHLVRYDIITPASWTAGNRDAGYELVIFDRFAARETPPGASLFIGILPVLPGLEKVSDLDAAWVVDWQRTHPLLRGISLLDRLIIHDSLRLSYGAGWSTLIEGEGMRWRDAPGADREEKIRRAEIINAPLLLCHLSEERRVAVLTFDILRSNWPLRVSFPLFVKNAVLWLARPGGLRHAEFYRTGETIRLEFDREVAALQIVMPDGRQRSAVASGSRSFYFADTRQPGIYRLRPAGQPERVCVCNLLSAEESDNPARPTVVLGREPLPAEKRAVRYNLELWPYAVLAALAFLCLEWYIYHRRVLG